MKDKKDFDEKPRNRHPDTEISQKENIANPNSSKKEQKIKESLQLIRIQYLINLNKKEFDVTQALLKTEKEIFKRQNKIQFLGKPIYIIILYAAIFIGILASSYFLICQKKTTPKTKEKEEVTLRIDNKPPQILKATQKNKLIKNEEGIVVACQKKNSINYADGPLLVTTSIHTITVPRGKRFQLTLPDGTMVHLNSDSSLQFPSNFNNTFTRKVVLSGEGYFEVTTDKDKPFIVETHGINTEVFGTKFNIKAHKNDPFSEITLIEGSVGVFYDKERFSADTDHKLIPNEKASLITATKKLTIKSVNSLDQIAWIDGSLVFKNESFANIIKQLERYYNVEIIMNHPELAKDRYTGRFETENINEVLKVFKNHTPFGLQKKNDKFYINP